MVEGLSPDCCRDESTEASPKFVIAGPVTTEDVVSNTRCVDASFTVSSGGEKHVICGTNSGHHIMLDAEESCNTLGNVTI